VDAGAAAAGGVAALGSLRDSSGLSFAAGAAGIAGFGAVVCPVESAAFPVVLSE
jgi:hypothetical protein